MFEKILIFGFGMCLGSYAMYNHLYKKVVKIALEPRYSEEKKETSETKES